MTDFGRVFLGGVILLLALVGFSYLMEEIMNAILRKRRLKKDEELLSTLPQLDEWSEPHVVTLYKCDGTICDPEHCASSECKYTADVTHAKNFKKTATTSPNTFYYVEQVKEEV